MKTFIVSLFTEEANGDCVWHPDFLIRAKDNRVAMSKVVEQAVARIVFPLNVIRFEVKIEER